MADETQSAVPAVAPDGSPEPPVLYGRQRLQAALDQAAKMPPRRLHGVGKAASGGNNGVAGQPADAVLWGLFQTEGWQAYKSLLLMRRDWYQRKLGDVAATMEELRVAQGGLFEINFLLNEEERIRTTADKRPAPLGEPQPADELP